MDHPSSEQVQPPCVVDPDVIAIYHPGDGNVSAEQDGTGTAAVEPAALRDELVHAEQPVALPEVREEIKGVAPEIARTSAS